MRADADTLPLTSAERDLWAALELDAVGERMALAPAPAPDDHQMGTGHTYNACFMCSNSATTAGCGTCGMVS